MDRVFAEATRPIAAEPEPPIQEPPTPEPPIEVEVRDVSKRWPVPVGSLALAGGLGCLTLVGGFGLWQGWQQAQHDLRQERNLRLLEGIRNLGSPADKAAADPAAPVVGSDEALPPPPPKEAWIEELGQLEARTPAAAPPLQVPLNGTLQAPAPPASADDAIPELLGVVQIPGKPGSAIFQVGGSSTNALVGEVIGSSGWTLTAADADSAVISRGGTRRRVSISSGF